MTTSATGYDWWQYLLQERLRAIYEELGAEDLEPILFTTLIEHPVIADMISNCNIFHSVVSQQLNLNKFYTSANFICTTVVHTLHSSC